MSKSIFLSIGTNKGDKISNCKLVTQKISMLSDIKRISSLYKTQSWGFSGSFFLNFVIEIQSNLSPHNLLKELIKIEKQMGRFRNNDLPKTKYESRIIDIDILFYGNQILNSEDLIIPHPRFSYRNFILFPLCELCPSFICPITGKKIEKILEICDDKSLVERLPNTINF